MSMSLASRPNSRSRTQPPTMSARPPASRTARAIAVAVSNSDMIGSGDRRGRIRPAAEAANHMIGQPRREGIQNDEQPRGPVWIDFRLRMFQASQHAARDVFRRLPRTMSLHAIPLFARDYISKL